jgi:CxxC motif-containing protein (DUF1111 family)
LQKVTGAQYIYRAILFTIALLGYEVSVAALGKNDEIAVNEIKVNIESPEAYTQPMPQLNATERKLFQHGRSLVRQAWTIPPSEDSSTSGLGPLYNRISCIACHHGNGRGFAPDSPTETMKAMLVRLSVTFGTTVAPHPVYGDQLNEYGVPGVKGEGRAVIEYSEKRVTLSDGETVQLRVPVITFKDMMYGDLGSDTLVSARIAPAIYGLGLLDNVEASEILRVASLSKPDGIAGRPNYVWDAVQQKTVIGKFGWKANVPNLKQQIASAFVEDLGITSAIFPEENCTQRQIDCLRSPSAGKPELAKQQLEAMTFYHVALAVPRPRSQVNQLGARLFNKAQCVYCHVPELKTSPYAAYARLNDRLIHPYTDLLLHDMGPELADHRPDHLASGREWRTPPLWGIGLAKKVNPQAGFLHDGRARTFMEAILWHGGEAENAKQRVINMSSDERKALVAFLESL